MKQVKISDLKAHLSAYIGYLRESDEAVHVYDRKTHVASLVPIEHEREDVTIEEAAEGPDTLHTIRPIRLRRPHDVVQLLRESRDQR